MSFTGEIAQQEQKHQEIAVLDGKITKTPCDFKDAYWLVISVVHFYTL